MSVSSGNSLRFSRWACRLSVRALLLPKRIRSEQLALQVSEAPAGEVSFSPDPAWVVPKWCYLSTLTFADPEPSYAEARKRFDSLRVWLNRTGKFGVCAPEFGAETKRLHFHLVHSVRWDAAEMWSVLKNYGFGRYDVRRRPAWRKPPGPGNPGRLHEAAWYLAKYIGKREDWPDELKGSRQWSVFGGQYFPHPPCGVRDVRISTRVLTVVKESPNPVHDVNAWRFSDHNMVIRHTVRLTEGVSPITNMRELNKSQQARILELLASGDVIGVGEYRFCQVETKEMDQYKAGVKTGNREVRVIVTHKVDFGVSCERREFDEILPSGSDPKSVAAPAKSGDMVAVAIDGQRAFNGGTNYKGRIFALTGEVKSAPSV